MYDVLSSSYSRFNFTAIIVLVSYFFLVSNELILVSRKTLVSREIREK